MANPPYPMSATNIPEFKLQGWRLFRDLYEERIAGCRIEGDVFVMEGDTNLEFNYALTGCLETTQDGGVVNLYPDDTGLILNEAGLGLETKQLGLKLGAGWGQLSTSILGSYAKGSINYTNGVMPGGEYSFYPLIYKHEQAFCDSAIHMGYFASLANYTTSMALVIEKTYEPPIAASATFFVANVYVTSSGEIYWIFIKRNKSTGEVTGSYFSPDHPCFGNGNDPLLVQHPFGEIKDDEEIIVINPTEEQVKKLKYLSNPDVMGRPRKPFREFIGEGKPFDMGKEEREYPRISVTIGIVKDEDKRPLWHKDTALITKCIIPQPDYVKVRNLHEYN